MLSISFLNASSDCSINYRCRKKKDMQLSILRNLETWSNKNKIAFAIKYVLQIPHRPLIATGTESKILGMFSIVC